MSSLAGNAEVDARDHGAGTMEAIYWGNCHDGKGSGDGPWVMADLENGLWGGVNRSNPSNPSLFFDFVTAVVKGDTGNHWSLKSGDAQTGQLTTNYDGVRPNGYHPMKKQVKSPPPPPALKQIVSHSRTSGLRVDRACTHASPHAQIPCGVVLARVLSKSHAAPP
jgi:hypothetical protein